MQNAQHVGAVAEPAGLAVPLRLSPLALLANDSNSCCCCCASRLALCHTAACLLQRQLRCWLRLLPPLLLCVSMTWQVHNKICKSSTTNLILLLLLLLYALLFVVTLQSES